MEQKRNARSIAARRRVEKEIAKDPEHYKKLGAKGGAAQVSKGIGRLPEEVRKELAKAGAKARHHKENAEEPEIPDSENE